MSDKYTPGPYDARLEKKYSSFVVLAWRRAAGCYAPIGKTTYPTIRAALKAAVRLEQGPRYSGQFLFIDASPAAIAALERTP